LASLRVLAPRSGRCPVTRKRVRRVRAARKVAAGYWPPRRAPAQSNRPPAYKSSLSAFFSFAGALAAPGRPGAGAFLSLAVLSLAA
jgi:hypothetical protein